MKAVAIICLAICSHALAESELPTWNDHGERAKLEASGWFAGSLLLVNEPLSDEETINLPAPTGSEIQDSIKPVDWLPEAYWKAYFGEKPQSFLVDPQGILSKADHKDRLAFLNYHAGDSAIDLYVYLFKGSQEIPGEVREEELIERCFSNKRPAVVIYYFMSEPTRSVLYLSPSLAEKIPPSERQRALESSMMSAISKPSPAAQFEAFLVQMSIRIYWMERMIGSETAGAPPLAMSTNHKPKEAKKPSELMLKIQPWIEKAMPMVKPAAATAGTMIIMMVGIAWLRRRARHRFPEFEVEPRLGGDHAAGIGAVISFANAAIPPASQKDQMPDYLRRV